MIFINMTYWIKFKLCRSVVLKCYVAHTKYRPQARFMHDSSGKETAYQCRRCKRHGFNICVKISCSRKSQPTPVFLPEKSQSSLTVQFMVSQRVRHNWRDLAYTRPKNNFYISKWLKNRRRIFHDRWKLYEIQISISISLGPSHVHSFTHCLW